MSFARPIRIDPGLRLARRLASGTSSIVPSIPNQTIDFPKLTRADWGDAPIQTTGGLSTVGATLSGTNAGRFKITAGGKLAKAASDNTALPDGPFDLTITSVGGIVGTLTIKTTGLDANGVDLGVSYSVADGTQLVAALQLTSGNGLAYGQNILLRAGTYAPMFVSRSALPGGGTFNPPAMKAVPDGQPAGHRGIDYDAWAGITVRPHANATAIIQRIQLNTGVNPPKFRGFRFTRLVFARPPQAGATNTGESGSLVSMQNGAGDAYVCFDNNEFYCDVPNTSVGNLDIYSGIYTQQGNVYIQDNYFHDVWNCVNIAAANANQDDTIIVGNLMTRVWSDALWLNAAGNRCKYNWNVIRDKLNDFKYNGGNHPDFMQLRNSTSTMFNDSDDWQMLGNRFYRGAVMPAQGYDLPGCSGSQGSTTLTINFGSRNGVYGPTVSSILDGPGIQPGTTVIASSPTNSVTPTSVTLSLPLTQAISNATLTLYDYNDVIEGQGGILPGPSSTQISKTGVVITNASAVVTMTSTSGLLPGGFITQNVGGLQNVPIVSVDSGTQITMQSAATSSYSGTINYFAKKAVITNGLIEGNFIIALSPANGIYPSWFKNGKVRNNTVLLHHPGTDKYRTTYAPLSIRFNGTQDNDNIECAYNLTNSILNEAGNTNMNVHDNLEIATSDYLATFGQNRMFEELPGTLTETVYSIAPGSAADTPPIKRGSMGTGYIDFAARSIATPYYAPSTGKGTFAAKTFAAKTFAAKTFR